MIKNIDILFNDDDEPTHKNTLIGVDEVKSKELRASLKADGHEHIAVADFSDRGHFSEL